MNMITLEFHGEISPEAKERLRRNLIKRDEHLKKLKEKYLNGDFDEFF